VLLCAFCARSSSGTELMCCSWDGTVAYFEFDTGEIGKPMTLEEKVLAQFLILILSVDPVLTVDWLTDSQVKLWLSEQHKCFIR